MTHNRDPRPSKDALSGDIVFAQDAGAADHATPVGDAGLVTAEDLLTALRKMWPNDPEQELRQTVRDWSEGGLDRPGIVWTEDILLHVALLSDQHLERIRQHRGWTPEDMEAKLQPIRARLRSY
jgi:hypothetical protein